MTDLNPPVTPGRTPASRGAVWTRPDLLLGVLTLVLLAVSLRGWPGALGALRVLAGAVAVLWLPGYALTLALFPARKQLRVMERAALSVGLSVGSVALLALLVSRLGFGFTPGMMLRAIAVWSALFAGAGLWRASRVAAPFTVRWQHAPVRWALGSVVALAAGMAVVVSLVHWLQPRVPTSEFYALGSQGRMEGYRVSGTPGERLSIPVRFTYHGREPGTFRVGADGSAPQRVGPLTDGQTWSGSVPVQLPRTSGPYTVVLRAENQANTDEQRRLEFSVDVNAAP